MGGQSLPLTIWCILIKKYWAQIETAPQMQILHQTIHHNPSITIQNHSSRNIHLTVDYRIEQHIINMNELLQASYIIYAEAWTISKYIYVYQSIGIHVNNN